MNIGQGAGVTPKSDRDQVIVSEHNALGENRYFDSASQTSFQVDHTSQVCPSGLARYMSDQKS
jgi:capping protein alpha